MKIPYYFGLFVLLCANVGNSYSSYLDTNLVEQIKPNPIARSKPTAPYVKYASVQFLQSDTKLTFASDDIGVKAKCASLGYMVPVSQCTGALKPSYLCSSDLNEAGAEQYTTNCCNSNLYTVSNPDACTDNATALPESCYWGGAKKYRCACDRSRYPYSELAGEGCGSNGDFNVNNMCRAANASGEKISYYASCCPTSYEECDNNKHLVGKGNSCRIASGGTIVNKYEYCECSSSYDTICADAMLIDSSDTCTDSHGKFTRDNNCESKCSQTSETNLDNYLYGYVWHCLYKGDGASVKTGEGRICDGYNQTDSIMQTDYYDECAAQGYVKTEADCYISDLVLHCPSDTSKVWCLDSRYCTGFPVGDTESGNACGRGINSAKVSFCGSYDKGVRCTYNDDRCNKCWDDGVYNPSAPGCANYDTSTKGDSEVCCKRGYRMVNGICVKNVCNRTLFPYELDPGSDQGVLEICYEGNTSAANGYDVYYGYSSCYSDAATGGMWKQADDNPRKCVCERNDDARGWLPFDLSLYFDSNSDTSEDYIHVGFNQGTYGEQRSCTDSEGSYYGYSSCYIGSSMGTTSSNKGMCLYNGQNSYTTVYPFRNDRSQGIGYVNLTIKAAGVSAITRPYRPITNSQPNTSLVYCINYNMHCKDGKGDTNVCNLTYNPVTGARCIDGYGQDCNYCYHISNLQETNGKYTLHNKFLLRIQSYENATYSNFGFETCPAERPLGGISSVGYGNCFKRCSKDDLSECVFGDIITDKTTNVDLGIVYYNNGSDTVYVLAITPASGKNYDGAVTYASTYAPAGNTDVRFAAGKWALPEAAMMTSAVMEQFSLYGLNTVYKYLGKTVSIDNSWTQTKNGTSGAYIRNCCGSTITYALTTTRYAIPALKLTY